MTTFINTTGSKKVNITYNDFNGFRASYIQIIKQDATYIREQVLDAKKFATEKKAINWGKQQLGIK